LYDNAPLQVLAVGARLLCKNKGDVSLAALAGRPAQSAADLAAGKQGSSAADDAGDDEEEDDEAAAAAAADEAGSDIDDEDADTAEDRAGEMLRCDVFTVIIVLCGGSLVACVVLCPQCSS
jgi:hypothetical protein